MKKWTFKFYHLVWGLLTLLLVPAMYTLVPYKLNTFFGIDSFLISMTVGALTFEISQRIYQRLKAKNNGHAHFPFEKVVFAIVSLLIMSIIFNYL